MKNFKRILIVVLSLIMALCSAQPVPAYANARVFTYTGKHLNSVCHIQLTSVEVIDYSNITEIILQDKQVKVITKIRSYSFSLPNEDNAIYYSQHLINEPECLEYETKKTTKTTK